MATDFKRNFPVSWDEFHRDSKALAWRLMERGPFKGIIAITRGGLVPAGIVARELDIRMIDTVCVASYYGDDQKQQGRIEMIKSVDCGDGAGWLVIDDLVDTGETIKQLRQLVPRAHFAAVYAKPKGRPMVDSFITEVSQDTWIYFPWDMERQPVQPMVRK